MTGAATRNIFVNDVRLSDVQTIQSTQPPELGLGFAVSANGTVTPLQRVGRGEAGGGYRSVTLEHPGFAGITQDLA